MFTCTCKATGIMSIIFSIFFQVIKLAVTKSKEFEASLCRIKAFRYMYNIMYFRPKFVFDVPLQNCQTYKQLVNKEKHLS